MGTLSFEVVGRGRLDVQVRYVLNAGYAGRDTAQVQAHVDELAELGVPAPDVIPTLYPLSAMLAQQASRIQVAHARTSGEAEWALIVPDGVEDADDYLVTVASDHTDRALEVHGVAWSKQSAPDLLGDVAWRWGDVRDTFDAFRLVATVTHDGRDQVIQDGSPADLLDVAYWLGRLGEAGLLKPGTVVLSGTIAMAHGVDQFAPTWQVELVDPDGNISRVSYDVEVLPEPWQ